MEFQGREQIRCQWQKQRLKFNKCRQVVMLLCVFGA
jgi:hypothetical protein